MFQMTQYLHPFKTEIYTGDDRVCSMCLDRVESGSAIYRLSCGHIFHAHNCVNNKGIMNWIEDNKTCPCCIATISDENVLKFKEIEMVLKNNGFGECKIL